MGEKFYCIIFIHKSGRRGYVYELPTQKLEVSPIFIDVCKKFSSVDEANQYIRKNKLNNWKGWKAYIRDENDIAKEKAKLVTSSEFFGIQNEFGQLAHFDEKKKKYTWKNTEVGCSAWQNLVDADNFIPKMRSYFPDMRFSSRQLNN